MASPDTRVASIGAVIRQSAHSFSQRVAMHEGETALTYAELDERVRREISYFRSLGIGAGDTVALLLGNGQPFVLAHYALTSMGAAVAPLNPQLRGRLLGEMIDLSDATCLVTSSELREMLLHIEEMPERLTRVVYADGGPEPDKPLTLATAASVQEEPGDPVFLSDFRADEAEISVDPDAPAIVFLTSGTTGKPKGIMVTHRQALLGLEAWVERWSFDESTVCLMVAPFFHVVYNPLVLGCHLAGGTSVVLTTLTPRAAMTEVERMHPNAIMGTPAIFTQLLNDRASKSRDLSSLDTIIYGAAPTSVPVIRGLQEKFPQAKLYNCYGLTETCSALSCMGSEDLKGREDSVGRAHPLVEVAIRDQENQAVATGELGEVCCRGPHVIRAYFNAPEANATRFFDDWLRTGDIGYLDEDGFLYLMGRSDDVINVAGEKVYPRDIEHVLFQHPEVHDVAVVGVKNDSKGQSVKAFIVPREKRGVDVKALKRFCITELPAAFVPRIYETLDELPRNPSGKVLRRQLTEQ